MIKKNLVAKHHTGIHGVIRGFHYESLQRNTDHSWVWRTCSIMFGPDFCGYIQRKVQAILARNGTNFPIKRVVPSEIDQMTHVYTFILRPNATYSILIDNDERQKGSLYSDWAILPPKRIKDPEARKVGADGPNALLISKKYFRSLDLVPCKSFFCCFAA